MGNLLENIYLPITSRPLWYLGMGGSPNSTNINTLELKKLPYLDLYGSSQQKNLSKAVKSCTLSEIFRWDNGYLKIKTAREGPRVGFRGRGWGQKIKGSQVNTRIYSGDSEPPRSGPILRFEHFPYFKYYYFRANSPLSGEYARKLIFFLLCRPLCLVTRENLPIQPT